MTESTQTQPSSSKIPSHIAYNVRERSDGEGFWSRMGCAWQHADGQGFHIQLESMPLN